MKTAFAATTALAVASTLTLAAAPALAAPVLTVELPAGDRMYAVATFGDGESDTYWQFTDVNPATGVLTPRGTTVTGVIVPQPWNSYQYQGAVDPSTGRAYVPVQNDDSTNHLAVYDVATGDLLEIIPLTLGGAPLSPDEHVSGIAIGPDGAYLYHHFSGDLYSVDLETGAVERITFEDWTHIHAFAYDAVTDGYYGIDYNDGSFYEVDVETGELATIDSLCRSDVVALQFDSNGIAWFVDEANILQSFDPAAATGQVECDYGYYISADTVPGGIDDVNTSWADLEASLIKYDEHAPLEIDGEELWGYVSLLILPADAPVVADEDDELAETGVENVTGLVGAAGLLLAAGTFLALRRRTARV